MKVGTDGVLLGAWFDAGGTGASGGAGRQAEAGVGEGVGGPGAGSGAGAENGPRDGGPRSGQTCGSLRRILDVGTGSGLIALMAAQRTAGEGGPHAPAVGQPDSPLIPQAPPLIAAIDIDPDCIADAAQNAKNSPWSERITVQHIAFGDLVRLSAPATFDRILSNPPYFSDSLLPPDSGRAGARHTLSLSPRQLARGAARLLAPGGLLAVILPPSEAEIFITECAVAGLYPRRRTEVRAFAHTPPKRVLLEMGFGQSDTQTGRLTIHEAPRSAQEVVHNAAPEEFAPEYRALTRDFYLKF